MLENPVEKRVYTFTFNKKDRTGSPVNIVLDVPGKTPEDATETLKQLFASMIMDLQEKYPVARKE